MRIEVVSDTICPWCFIGKRRLERALAQRPGLEVEIGWRPFQLNPDMPAGGLDRRDYLAAKFGGGDRAQRIYDTIRTAGAEEGIAFDFERIARTPNTIDSHRLIRWAASAGMQDRVVELLFRRYFQEGADIGSRAVLVEAASEAGMDGDLVGDLLDRGEDSELVAAEDRVARELGIQGVPCFIIDRRYAVSGAQDPGVFLHVFDLAGQPAAAATAPA